MWTHPAFRNVSKNHPVTPVGPSQIVYWATWPEGGTGLGPLTGGGGGGAGAGDGAGAGAGEGAGVGEGVGAGEGAGLGPGDGEAPDASSVAALPPQPSIANRLALEMRNLRRFIYVLIRRLVCSASSAAIFSRPHDRGRCAHRLVPLPWTGEVRKRPGGLCLYPRQPDSSMRPPACESWLAVHSV